MVVVLLGVESNFMGSTLIVDRSLFSPNHSSLMM